MKCVGYRDNLKGFWEYLISVINCIIKNLPLTSVIVLGELFELTTITI